MSPLRNFLLSVQFECNDVKKYDKILMTMQQNVQCNEQYYYYKTK